MSQEAIFDHELDHKALFDVLLNPEAWFDPEILGLSSSVPPTVLPAATRWNNALVTLIPIVLETKMSYRCKLFSSTLLEQLADLDELMDAEDTTIGQTATDISDLERQVRILQSIRRRGL